MDDQSNEESTEEAEISEISAEEGLVRDEVEKADSASGEPIVPDKPEKPDSSSEEPVVRDEPQKVDSSSGEPSDDAEKKEESSFREPIIRDVVFSMAQTLEQEEALKTSVSAFFTKMQFSVTVTFESTTKMLMTITPPEDWKPLNADAIINASINEALSATWTIIAPEVRVVTFSIGLNEEQQEELKKFLTTFATEKQFSVTVTFNSAEQMTLGVKPPRTGLNNNAFIILALTAAQHPLLEDVLLLPKDETWTLSKPSNPASNLDLDSYKLLGEDEASSVSGEGEAASVGENASASGESEAVEESGEGEAATASESCSNDERWKMVVEVPIQTLITFSVGFNSDEKKALQSFISDEFELNPNFRCKRVVYHFMNIFRITLKLRKGTVNTKPNILTVINDVLTEAGNKGLFGKNPSRTWIMKHVSGRTAKFNCEFSSSVQQKVLKLLNSILAREGYLSVASAWWSWDKSALYMYFTPQTYQNSVLLNVDEITRETLKEALSRSPSPYNASTFELAVYD